MTKQSAGELARKAALFREGAYEGAGANADMWFFELWHHFLRDVEDALAHPAPQDEMRRALERAENYFELIRQKLIHNLSEPDRSAFWAAVEARDMIRAAIKQGGGE